MRRQYSPGPRYAGLSSVSRAAAGQPHMDLKHRTVLIRVTGDGNLDITVKPKKSEDWADAKDDGQIKEDPVELSIYAHRFMGIAEQMGRTLARTAISVNIKERLDFSCALFTSSGGLVANGSCW